MKKSWSEIRDKIRDRNPNATPKDVGTYCQGSVLMAGMAS